MAALPLASSAHPPLAFRARIASRPQIPCLAPRPRNCSQRLSVTSGGMKDWRSRSGDDGSSSGGFEPSARKRLENAWKVRQQAVPVACERCRAEGVNECEWCSGSGYFVLGDKMLCEVPSRNTTCLICHGHGSVRCPDCLGTGFRARWLETVLENKEK